MTEASYQRRTFTHQHRQLLSDSHRARLGIPLGKRRVYGHLMTEEMAEEIWPIVAEVSRRRDRQAAHEILRRTLAVSEEYAIRVAERFVRLLCHIKASEYSSRSKLRLRVVREERASRLRKSEQLVPRETVEMAEMMLAEGATKSQVAQYLRVQAGTLERALGRLTH